MTMKSPDLNLLPIAFALYDQLSVSRAARLLGMSQPAVSMALRRMRAVFDDPLFIRVPTALRQTPRAHGNVRLARPLVERCRRSAQGRDVRAGDHDTGFHGGPLRRGGMAFLPRVLSTFQRTGARTPPSDRCRAAEQLRTVWKGRDRSRGRLLPGAGLEELRQRRIHPASHASCGQGIRDGPPSFARRFSPPSTW